jgi:chromosome partitioning protein
MSQIRIAVLANAGGVGKTTLVSNLAYILSQQKISVAIIDLDPQRSLDTFCGLPEVLPEHSTVGLLGENFSTWNLSTPWEIDNIALCQSHPQLSKTAQEIVTRKRGEYILADRLEDAPLPHQVVLIDCPATFGTLCENAVAAATHLLIPLQLEVKAIAGLNDLVEKVVDLSKALKLKPRPPIMGLVPSLYNKDLAIHRQYAEELPEIAQMLGTKAYPTIRLSAEFKNACAYGIPLRKYRPGHPANGDFTELTKDIVQLVKANGHD